MRMLEIITLHFLVLFARFLSPHQRHSGRDGENRQFSTRCTVRYEYNRLCGCEICILRNISSFFLRALLNAR